MSPTYNEQHDDQPTVEEALTLLDQLEAEIKNLQELRKSIVELQGLFDDMATDLLKEDKNDQD